MYLNKFPEYKPYFSDDPNGPQRNTAFDPHGYPIIPEGVDPDDCRRAGGIPRYQDVATGNNFVRRVYTCEFPSGGQAAQAAQAPKINVTVPTNTQVSPQISPQFIQQDKPTDSGINAGVDVPGAGASLAQQIAAALNEAYKTAQQPAQQPQVMYIPAPQDNAAPADVPAQDFGNEPALPNGQASSQMSPMAMTLLTVVALGAVALGLRGKRKGK